VREYLKVRSSWPSASASAAKAISSWFPYIREPSQLISNGDLAVVKKKNVYTVYILTNWKHTVFYVGVTNNLFRRVFEHKIKLNNGFTAWYNVNQLIYYEEFKYISDALHREKQLKKYKRQWKKNLVNSFNPEWADLSDGWYDPREFEAFKQVK